MALPTPPYPTSSIEFERTRSGHNAKYTPADYIPKEALRDLIIRSAPHEQGRNVDLETTLAHERLTQMPMYDDLGMLYGELYTASPIPPFDVSSSDFLGHLFAPGETVLVAESGDRCCLWESEHSPDVAPFKSEYFPYTIDLARLDRIIRQGREPQIQDLAAQYKYAAAWFTGNDVGELFQQFIQRQWPVAAVISSGDYHTEVLFRVNAISRTAWKAACQGLEQRIAEFCPIPKFKFQRPALLPCAMSEQRLIYLAPG